MNCRTSQGAECEIFVLAGGLSTRMGRDKSRVRVGKQTMLAHVQAAARGTGLKVRVIRRDAVDRCGPLGGIYTGLVRSRAEVVMFLACDMPFLTTELLEEMLGYFLGAGKTSNIDGEKGSSPRSFLAGRGRKIGKSASSLQFPAGVFAGASGQAGFPCLLRREAALEIVRGQIEKEEFSLQALVKKLGAKVIRPGRFAARELSNINTPAELKKAQSLLKHSLHGARKTARVAGC